MSFPILGGNLCIRKILFDISNTAKTQNQTRETYVSSFFLSREKKKMQTTLQSSQSRKRCERNRKRSKRRAIYCPIHSCYLDSVSQKYSLYADRIEQLRQRGFGKRSAFWQIKNKTLVVLENEWLEAFWCDECQKTEWYHVIKCDRTYHLSVAPRELWQQATGVSSADGNPSVGEFTRRQARALKI